MKARIIALIEFDEADLGRIKGQVSEFLQLDPEITSVRVWDEEADEGDDYVRATKDGSPFD